MLRNKVLENVERMLKKKKKHSRAKRIKSQNISF